MQLRPKWSLSSIAISSPVSLPPVTSLYVAPPFLSVPPALCSLVYALPLPLLLSPPLSPTLSRRLFVPLTQTHTQRRSWRILQSSAQQATTQRTPAAIHCATLAATTNLSTAQCHEAARQHISCVTSSVTTVRVYICMYGGGWVCGQVCIIQICIYIHIHSPQRCLCMHTDTYLNAYILPPEAEHTHMQHLMQQQ